MLSTSLLCFANKGKKLLLRISCGHSVAENSDWGRYWDNRKFVFIIILQFMLSANIRIRFGLQILLVCLYSTPSHYHHCADLSEGIELIKCLSDIYFVDCVNTIKHILSVIHYTRCGAVCFQFTHFCCDDWENIYYMSYYHHQIGSINYNPLFRARSWNNGVRCMSSYILIELLSINILQEGYFYWVC